MMLSKPVCITFENSKWMILFEDGTKKEYPMVRVEENDAE